MSFKATPKQTLALWYLIALYVDDKKEPTKGDFRILRGAERKPLEEAGLIEYEKKPRLLKNNRKSYPEHIILTDKAWRWAENNSDMELSKSKYSADILEKLVPKIVLNLHRRKIRLTEFLLLETETFEEEYSDKVIDTDSLEEKICAAYLKISGGNYKVRVRLSELRQYIEGWPRLDLDKTLIEMQRLEKIILMPLDNPQEIHPKDEEAALDLGGAKRHILYMEG